MIYFTADTHFGHRNIVRYSNRPFENVREMDEELIRRWNIHVRPTDTVYHLGDVALCPSKRAREILDRLNGTIHLILGNHDSTAKSPGCRDRFESIEKLKEIEVENVFTGQGQRIVLCHYAMRTWNKSHRGAWHLYGHSHGSLPDDPHALSLDVGVDTTEAQYAPMMFEHIYKIMSRKHYKPVDHHTPNRG